MKMTPARRLALWTLACNHGEARYSNATDVARGHLLWQQADTLIANGYAERATGVDPPVVLTDAGWDLIIEGESDDH